MMDYGSLYRVLAYAMVLMDKCVSRALDRVACGLARLVREEAAWHDGIASVGGLERGLEWGDGPAWKSVRPDVCASD